VYRRATQSILAFVVVTLLGWDAFVYHAAGPEATISVVTRDLFLEFPVAAVAVGLIVGHIAWPLSPKK